jgi:Dolichyl-phosphate-mannose-protein mannosyltransferase
MSVSMNQPHELEIEPQLETPERKAGIRSQLIRFLNATAVLLEHESWMLFAIMLLPYLGYIGTHARFRPLWHDELYTYYIAQAPTFDQMLHETRTLDLNPPLSYMAVRFVFRFLHPGNVSARLPSMVAFFTAALLLYSFVRRRTNRVYGTLGALLLLGSTYKGYALEARPYALVLGFLGVAAVGWQRATEEGDRGRWWGLLLLVLGGFGMLLSHVLATIAYGAFFFAEFVRLIERRKPDWLLWICLLLPLSSMHLYKSQVQSHGAGAFPSVFQASLSRLVEQDHEFWTDLCTLLALTMVTILVVRGRSLGSESEAGGEGFSVAERALAAYLFLMPVMITLLFMRSHSAYFGRYGMPAVFGAAILVPWLIAYWSRGDRVAGLLGVVVFFFWIIPPTAIIKYGGLLLHPAAAANPELTGDSPVPLAQIDPALPLVDASGLTFMEMNSREDGKFLSRVYYLTDAQAALQYSHATIFEGLDTVKHAFQLKGNVEPYKQFIQEHPRFLVYGTFDYAEDWLLRKLLADGASLRFLGDFSGGYKDSTLYEVTIPQR